MYTCYNIIYTLYFIDIVFDQKQRFEPWKRYNWNVMENLKKTTMN